MKSEPLPLKIGKPCPKSWDEMSGDSKRRFCEHCQLHVHNLSAMSSAERTSFVASSGGKSCIAYQLRSDGSMITPSRWAGVLWPVQRLQWAVAAVLAAMLPFFFASCTTRRSPGDPTKAGDSWFKPRAGDHCEMTLGVPLPPEPQPAKKP